MENPKERAAAAREILAKFQRQAFVTNPGIEEVEDLVTDLLELDIEYTKKHEPYATNSIERMRIARDMVRYLHMLFEED